MQNCISFAVSCNVGVLELDFSNPTWDENDVENHEPEFDLPMQVYQNGTLALESLTLFACSFNSAWLMNLKLLKHLSFGWIAVRMSTLNDLLTNCPCLESLRLKKCWNLEPLSIFQRDLALKTLVVDNCNFHQEWIGIEAPNLRFFKYSRSVGIFELILTRQLEEAGLDFGSKSEFDESGGDLLQRHLSSLDCARVLKVCSFMLQDYQPRFKFDPSRFWSGDIDRLSKCVLRTLKVVEVKGFQGTINENNLLRYLLYYGRAMQELGLYLSNEVDGHGGDRSIYLQRAMFAMAFPRALPNVHVRII